MEKLRKTRVLDWKYTKRSYVLTGVSNCCLKPKFDIKIKELRLSQFLHYCS